MFKPLAALIAATTFAMPAVARVEASTPLLLKTLNDYGITVRYNHSDCSNGFQGRYSTSKVMDLCYSGSPSAEDHDTVRHETAHVLQHCAAIRRGANNIQPLAADTTTRLNWVRKILPTRKISVIQENYPVHHHQVELEAFAMAHHYTANDLITYIKLWCIKP